MMKPFRTWCFLVLVLLFSSADVSANMFSKISYDEQKSADKLLISLHHAVLEINRNEKYIIATLTEPEKQLLMKKGFQISAAKQWAKKLSNTFPNYDKPLFNNTGSQYLNTIDGFECYATVEETYSQAQALADNFPKLASWRDIGDSWMKANAQGGYDLMVLKITNSEITATKPILFVHSSMHAREYAPAALNLDFAYWLLNNYLTNAEAKWIVDNREVHLMFHMNPDGRKIAENQIFQRKNTNQNHCSGSTVGVDLNRNFAQTWGVTANGSSGDECSEVYRGSSAESEPETQAVSNYIRSLFPDERGENDDDAAPQNKSGMHIDLHSYGKLILWPYGHKEGVSPNNNGFLHLGHKLAWFNDYTPQQSIGLYATDGTSDNVSYGELGVAAITFELGSSFFQNCSEYDNKIKPDNLKALIYSAKVSEAPYLLSTGPDVSVLKLNNNIDGVTVVPASLIDVDISTSKQTNLASASNDIELFEYIIDGSFTERDKVISLQNLEVVNETVSTKIQLNTAELALGQHIISVRAKNADDQYGVVQSAFINISDSSAPTPSFTFDCQYLNCTFDASQSIDSDGEVTSYQWARYVNDDELEIIGNGKLLQYNFAQAGDVKVRLLIEDNSQLQASIEQVISLEVDVTNKLPEPKFTASCQNLTCDFNASQSVDSDGEIVQFQWSSITSGTSEIIGAGETLTHSFTSAGSIIIRLLITDNRGAEASSEQTITLTNIEATPDVPERASSGGGAIAILLYLMLGLPLLRAKKLPV